MNDNRHLLRRKVLGMAVASGLTLLTAPLRSIAQQVTRRTPAQILGPYYPVIKPTDRDTDLTMIAGRPGRAQGQVIYVAGRVINRHGQPLAGGADGGLAGELARPLHASERPVRRAS